MNQKDVEMPSLGDLSDSEINPEDLRKVELDKETIQAYEEIFEKDTTFWQRLGRFIKAENKAGQKAKIIKDGILAFAPWGKQVSTGTELLTEIIKDDQKDMNIIKKALSIQGAKDFLKWKDEDGNFSWEQVGVSLLQIGILVLLAWLDSQFGLGLIKMLTGS